MALPATFYEMFVNTISEEIKIKTFQKIKFFVIAGLSRAPFLIYLFFVCFVFQSPAQQLLKIEAPAPATSTFLSPGLILRARKFPTSVSAFPSNISFVISDESANEKEESKSEEQALTMEEHLEMLDRVRRESEESRKFWKEELRSMNKWERYGLG